MSEDTHEDMSEDTHEDMSEDTHEVKILVMPLRY